MSTSEQDKILADLAREWVKVIDEPVRGFFFKRLAGNVLEDLKQAVIAETAEQHEVTA